jgi:UDP-galactopyranose mutase
MQLEQGQGGWPLVTAGEGRRTLLCFSHLQWAFVFQRPQHLLTRAAATMRVVYWEEPVWSEGAPRLHMRPSAEGVLIAQPHMPHGCDADAVQRQLLDAMLRDENMADPILWYYTPQALAFSDHLKASVTVYDCMDELSAFAGADPSLSGREQALLRRADLVFTGGWSLYEAKRRDHRDVHAFQSGVDAAHFRPARAGLPDPDDQRRIPHPRVGFYGVLDERLDMDLLAALADLRPGVQFVLVGPTAKIDPGTLPARANLHYLGAKPYAALPGYVANWQAAMMPFAINKATRFISPTKTPEFLAAGLPVVSTPVADLVRQYGECPGVQIAGTPQAFAGCIDQALALQPASWQPAADALLAGMSWDGIWADMAALISQALASKPRPAPGAFTAATT